MKILVVLARYQYADVSRGETHEYTALYSAIANVFRNVHFIDTSLAIRTGEMRHLNINLIEQQRLEKYTHVFFVQWGNEFFPETIEYINKTGAITINWATDDSYRYENFTKHLASRYSLNITTDRAAYDKYMIAKFPCYFGGWGFNKSLSLPPKLSRDCKYDICFIGLNYFDRAIYIDAFKKAGYTIFLGGDGWGESVDIVSSKNMPHIYNNSKVALNFSKSVGGSQTKARVFEVTSFGTCLLSELSPDLETYFDIGEDILVFTSVEDCLKQIDSLIKKSGDLRDRVAFNGYTKCMAKYSYEELFKKIFGTNNPAPVIDANDSYAIKTKNKIYNQIKFMALLKYLVLNKFTPNIFKTVIRKIESKFFIENYLSSNSLLIKD